MKSIYPLTSLTGESMIMNRFLVFPILVFSIALGGCANAAPSKPGMPLKTSAPYKAAHPLKPARHFVIQTRKNILLSATLKHFLHRHGWSMVWNDPDDDLVQYPARYVSKTLTGVLRHVLLTYHLTMVMKEGNRVAIINREQNHD